MPAASELQSASQGLAVGVSMIALFLGLRQWYEHRARWDLSRLDATFYRGQDVRRWLGVFLLTALAAIVFGGSWVHPSVGGKANIAFVFVWLAVMALIVLTLAVALWDWTATFFYARSKRRALLDDHVDELRSHLRTVADAARRERQAGTDDATPDA